MICHIDAFFKAGEDDSRTKIEGDRWSYGRFAIEDSCFKDNTVDFPSDFRSLSRPLWHLQGHYQKVCQLL